MKYSIKHLDGDTHKSVNFTRDYSENFNSEEEAFLFVAKINERQKFCYGQYDFFNDVETQKKYDKWRSTLTINQYKNL